MTDVREEDESSMDGLCRCSLVGAGESNFGVVAAEDMADMADSSVGRRGLDSGVARTLAWEHSVVICSRCPPPRSPREADYGET